MPAVASAVLLAAAALVGTHAQATTLGETVSKALELANQQSRVAALRGEGRAIETQARSLTAADPALRLKLLSDRATENDGAYELEAMVDMPLWLPGQRGARVALAQALGARADALQRLLRWEMAGLVREAAWTAALADGRRRQAAAALAAARSLEATVRKRTVAGELAKMDLLVARQETLTLEGALSAAEREQAQAVAALAQLTGAQQIPQPLPDAEPGGDMASAATLPDTHPLLASGGGALSQAQAERERERADRRGNPVLSIGGQRARDDRALDAVDAIQLEVSLPFGLKRQAAPRIAAAERAYTEQLAELHRIRREAQRTLEASVLADQGAAAALVAAERRAALAAEALSLARRAFDLGEADLTTLLRAEERAREANLDSELRRLERGRAISRLNQALGVIPQ
ncbi:MAG: TolC family protein [Thiohalocapsa sp.]|nr:TolC family protein [Thiohalocapsa sp.]